jgi:hypothetical protein
MITRESLSREGLYTDIVLNETLCERFTGHMAGYGKEIIQKYDKVLTGSSDVGEFNSTISKYSELDC